MDILLKIAAAYVVIAFVRDIYRLSTGFLYTTPKNVRRSPRQYRPLVSVVIPAWNEEVGVIRTIDSVIDNGYWNIEIIVVDDGSTDNTARVVQELVDTYPEKIHLITKQNGGKSSALNTGIAHANGLLILTLDADSFIKPGSILKMVGALSNNEYGVAIGEVVVGNTKTWLGRAQHYEYTLGFHIKRAHHVFDSAYIFPGALTMFRTSVLQEVGSFTDYSSTEDLDISMRIKMAGHKIVYVDSATCVTEGASTLKGLLNQRTRWRHGYLECLIHRKEFLVSPKKGWYLTLIDLPLQLFGVLEVLMFPIILLFLGYLVAINSSPLSLIVAYCLVPFTLMLLADMRDKGTRPDIRVLAVPILLLLIAWIEYIALLKSIYRTIRRKRTTWTVWQRSGAASSD